MTDRKSESGNHRRQSRRRFAATASGAAAALVASPADSASSDGAESRAEQRVPLKLGHRAASMDAVGDFEVFQLARRIPGLMGVELQVAQGTPNLRDLDAVRRYKREARRWGIMTPSLAGVWDRGVSILRSPVAGVNLFQSIRAAELLGAGVVLVAFFRENTPDMSAESSYGPVVELLRGVAGRAADAGVVLGLENSLSPADNLKLVDAVQSLNVRVYYDVFNVAQYGHGDQVVAGVKLLGRERICQVHVKNGERLIEDSGPIDWPAVFAAFNQIDYDGWYVFESKHSDREQLIRATIKNIAYLKQLCRMPLV